MNIYTNEGLVRKNARIAQLAMGGGLAILFGGMILTFMSSQYFYLSMGALILGFILSQVGIYFSNRFGKRPRPYEILNRALKGLDNKYSIYHYLSPTSHLLLGPAGIYVLIPHSQSGRISFSGGRYRQKGGSLYLKIFAQESLGRPEIEVSAETDKIKKFIETSLEADHTPPVRGILVFTHPNVELIEPEDESDIPAAMVTADKLKDLIRKSAKDKTISLNPVQIEEIKNLIPVPE